MTRVLLLLPSSTYRAADFLAAAKRLGVEVVVASDTAQTIDMGDRALVVDPADPQAAAAAIVACAARLPIDAVVAVDDQGVRAAAVAAARLGLRHNPYRAVAATRDKAALRRALAGAGGVAQPAFVAAGPEASDEGLVRAAATVGFPVVVKATSLSGSRGVIRADDPDALVSAARRVRAILADAGAPDGDILIESYVDGVEVAVEGLLSEGRLEVLALFDKPDPLTGPFFEETIYVTPSRLPAAARDAVTATVAAAAGAVGLVEGPLHAEVRIDPEGLPWLIEMAARTIGGLCGRSLRFGSGASLEEVVLRHALGLPSEAELEPGASGVMMLPIHKRGRLVEVRGQEQARAVPGVTALEVSVAPGRAVKSLPEADRYLGFLFARGATTDAVETTLRRAYAALEVVIEEA